MARWLVKLRNDASNTNQTTTYEHDWVISDGTSLNQFVNDLGVDNSAVSDLNNQVQNYTSLMSQYMALKHQYQTKDLRNLIASDISLQAATSNVDSVSEDHFFTY